MEMSSDRGSTPRRSIDLNLCKSRIYRGFSLLKMRKIVVLDRFEPFQTVSDRFRLLEVWSKVWSKYVVRKRLKRLYESRPM